MSGTPGQSGLFPSHPLRRLGHSEIGLAGDPAGMVLSGHESGRAASDRVDRRQLDGLLSQARPTDSVLIIVDPDQRARDPQLVDRMFARYRADDVDAVFRAAPVTEAIKEVAGGQVSSSVDRSTLVAVRLPVVVRRAALEAALRGDARAGLVSPVATVAAAGGIVVPLASGA